MIMINKFLFKLTNFCVITCFLTKLLTTGILFSTAVNAVAKLLISGILFSNSNSFVDLTKLVAPGFFCLILFYLFDIKFLKQTH